MYSLLIPATRFLVQTCLRRLVFFPLKLQLLEVLSTCKAKL
jgi:hypothetical protein